MQQTAVGMPKKRTPDDRQQRWLEDLSAEFRYEIVLNESDRGAVLIAASFIEEALEHLLRQVLTTKSCNASDEGYASQLNRLIKPGVDAPLGSFSARITTAYVLGIIDANYLRALDSLRNLRNGFAHRRTNGARPELSMDAIKHLNAAVIAPGVWDIRHVGLLPDDVDFDSTVATVGLPRVTFALAVWMLLRTIIDETEWWKDHAVAGTPIRSVPKFSGSTYRDTD